MTFKKNVFICFVRVQFQSILVLYEFNFKAYISKTIHSLFELI